MNLVFRQAVPSDAPCVADIYLESRRPFLPFVTPTDDEVRRWIAEVLIPAGGVTLAIRDAEVVGMMALSRDGRVGWIEQLYLRPDAVGQGIAADSSNARSRTWGCRSGSTRSRTTRRPAAAMRGMDFRPFSFSDGHHNEEHCPDILYQLDGSA